MKQCTDRLHSENYQIILTGDFNFPYIQWSSGKIDKNVGIDLQSSAQCFVDFLWDSLLEQYVHLPTRSHNTLDLFITNNKFLVRNVSATETPLSDHKLIEIMLSLEFEKINQTNGKSHTDKGFKDLDFQLADFDAINSQISQVPWSELFEVCSFEEFPSLFTLVVLQICLEYAPFKKRKSGKPKKLHALKRKKHRINEKIEKNKAQNGNPVHLRDLERKLANVTFKMKEAIYEHLDQRENKIVNRIKDNPKVFYSFAKSHSSVKSNISMLLLNSGEVVNDDESMANTFQQQFSSVFSNPSSPDVRAPNFQEPEIVHEMTEDMFIITEVDVLKAISDIKSDSAAGPDELPAIVLKKCAGTLSRPIQLLWQESFKRGVVPFFYKKSYVCPLYKKGDRAKAANYRPVSMTSHVVKIYERIIRKIIVAYLEHNHILTTKQHGFRSGRSTLTQLLAHFDKIYNGLIVGSDTDSIYLDYAKAFDKVDHRLLLLKLEKYKFHPKLITWIKSFLSDRCQRVVVNGKKSLPANIISGVPQGTVLGPALFIIFINDLEARIKHSNISFFADDTRISKQICKQSHCEELQEDLDTVILWSKENNMKLHEDKFELIINEADPKTLIHELPFAGELYSYHVSESIKLSPIDDLRDLGIRVVRDSSWSDHIHRIAATGSSAAAWVLSVFRS